MFLPHTSRVPVLFVLSALTGLGLLAFTHLYPFTWQVDLRPVWGWTLFGMGLSVILLSLLGFLWPPLEEHWPVLVFLCAIGLLIAVAGWDLEWALFLLSYLVRGLMYLAGLALIGFAVRELIAMQSDSATWSLVARDNRLRAEGYDAGRVRGYDEGYANAYKDEHDRRYEEGHSAGRAEWYAKGHAVGRTEGYEEGHSAGHAEGYKYGHAAGGRQRYREGYDEGHAKGYTEGRADSAAREKKTRSFNPWEVLEITSGSTPEEIKRAYRKQSKLYHPDKVSQLGRDLREMAENKTKNINRAYDRLQRH